MEKKITLTSPILINGKNVKEFKYSTDEITADLFMQAEAGAEKKSGYKGGFTTIELNSGLHLYLGFAAVIAVNPEIDFADLERAKGRDLMEFIKVGRTFITGSGESSKENNSAEQSETSHESITQA